MEFDGALVHVTFWVRVYNEFVSQVYEIVYSSAEC